MADFVYLPSAKTYVRPAAVSEVDIVVDGEVTTGYNLIVDGNEVFADESDAGVIHSDILGIPQDIHHP